MSEGNVRARFDRLIVDVAHSLAPLGFVRRERMLKSISNGNAAIIEFQKSLTSTQDQVKFTINLGIVCGALLDLERMDIRRSRVMHAHLQKRLGFLLEPAYDVWWDLTPSTPVDSLAAELSSLIATKAIPYLERYRSTEDLVALWESGKSPGITEVQRERFLSALRQAG